MLERIADMLMEADDLSIEVKVKRSSKPEVIVAKCLDAFEDNGREDVAIYWEGVFGLV